MVLEKSCIRAIILLLFVVCQSKVEAYYSNILKSDSIFYYKQICNADKYYKSVEDLISGFDDQSDSLYFKKIQEEIRWLDQVDFLSIKVHRKLLSVLGYQLKSTGYHLNEAIIAYEKSHKLLHKLPEATDYWYVENTLATLYNMKGDHEKALNYYNITKEGLKRLILREDEAIETYRDQYLRLQNNIGYLFYWDKKSELAIGTLRNNLLDGLKYKNPLATTNASKYLTEIFLSQNEMDSVAKYLLICERSLINVPENKRLVHKASFMLIKGDIARTINDCNEAIKYYKEALSQTKDEGRFDAKTYVKLAQSQINCHQMESAFVSIQKGFSLLGVQMKELFKTNYSIPEDNTIGELASSLTDFYLTKYQLNHDKVYLDSAHFAIQICMTSYQLIREGLLLENSKFLLINDYRIAINKAIKIIFLKYKSQPDSLAVSFQVYASQSKNLLLTDFENERKIHEQLSNKDRQIVQNLRIDIRKATSSIQQEKDQSTINSLNNQIISIRSDIHEITSKVNKKEDSFLLRSGQYIDYMIVGEELFSIHNFNRKLEVINLGSATIINDLIVSTLTEIGKKSDDKIVYKYLSELFQKLFSPHISLPKAFTIFPDGLLHLVPFAALIEDYKTCKYLIQNHEICIGYDSKRSVEKKESNNKIKVLAPEYPTSNHGDIAMSRGSMYHLPFAQKEALEIAEIFQQDDTIDKSCGKERFFQYLEHFGIIHFSGHTISNLDGTFLALQKDSASWLSIAEVNRATINAQSIVLSACETGLGSYHPGDGINSLARGFLNAGIDEVVYSLWNINDQTTSQIMKQYYMQIKNGITSAAALRNAQLLFLENNSGQKSHPYYWAAFSLVRPTTSHDSSYAWYLIGVCVCIGILFFIYKQNKRS